MFDFTSKVNKSFDFKLRISSPEFCNASLLSCSNSSPILPIVSWALSSPGIFTGGYFNHFFKVKATVRIEKGSSGDELLPKLAKLGKEFAKLSMVDTWPFPCLDLRK